MRRLLAGLTTFLIVTAIAFAVGLAPFLPTGQEPAAPAARQPRRPPELGTIEWVTTHECAGGCRPHMLWHPASPKPTFVR